MTSDFLIDKKCRTGFHIGVLTEIPFRDKFSLQPKFYIQFRGLKAT